MVLLVPLISALLNGAWQTRRKATKNELYERLTDNVLGVSEWIVAGRGSEYVETYKSSEMALRSVDTRLNRSSRTRDLVLQVLYALIATALLLWAGLEFGGSFAGQANWIAAFVLGFFPLIDAFAPLSRAALETNTYRNSLDRLNKLPDEQEEVKPALARESLPKSPYDICMERLTYRYPHASNDVFKDFDLTITSGEKLAICGRSGSGKSTLAALIRGDLMPQEGSVTLGGTDTGALGERAADYYGVIQQQTYLFNTTLAENLRVGNQQASTEELWLALERVGLKDMVERLPEGLETLVDEAGLRFSGGERHRIALARVLLSDVPIVILDEPAAGLDPITEWALLHTIFETMADKTVIMITHHLLGMQLMDRVIFIEEGALALSGSPDELAQNSPYYQKLLAFDTGDLLV